MDKDEALRLALEALKGADEIDCDMRDAITAIEAALEAKDEPMHPDIKKLYEDYFDKCFRESSAPPQRTWVGLTDEEVDQFHNWKDCTWSTNELVRYVEAKLKEKNT